MESLAKMKRQLTDLEEQKLKLDLEMDKTSTRFKLALGGTLLGAVLSVFYGLGFILLIAGVVAALFYGIQQTKNRDKLTEIEAQIRKLSISMV